MSQFEDYCQCLCLPWYRVIWVSHEYENLGLEHHIEPMQYIVYIYTQTHTQSVLTLQLILHPHTNILYNLYLCTLPCVCWYCPCALMNSTFVLWLELPHGACHLQWTQCELVISKMSEVLTPVYTNQIWQRLFGSYLVRGLLYPDLIVFSLYKDSFTGYITMQCYIMSKVINPRDSMRRN